MDQLRRIFKLCGRPTVVEWPTLSTTYEVIFDKYCDENFEEESRKMDQYLETSKVSTGSKDVIIACLQMIPDNRPTAAFLLDFEYLRNTKEPKNLPKLRVQGSLHEYATKKMKKEHPDQITKLEKASEMKEEDLKKENTHLNNNEKKGDYGHDEQSIGKRSRSDHEQSRIATAKDFDYRDRDRGRYRSQSRSRDRRKFRRDRSSSRGRDNRDRRDRRRN
mmetsp:Transcript_2043/g.2417  ORF Transcript_2043/g.2417 Transcript_2043/m.2417 type:complete len:219 (+) Transcript_2043:2-658(+)